jgi:hypothetical protein
MGKALAESKGYPYAAGYIESFLVDVIERFVADSTAKTMLHIEMLNIAIDNKLDKLGPQAT